MSHLSKIFTSTPVDIPNRSGFDLSHENIGSLKVGTLTPVLTEELLPNDTVSLGCLAQVTLPPMATDFYGRVDLRLEAFFCPMRILWAAWQRFYTMPLSDPFQSTNQGYRPVCLPFAFITGTGSSSDTTSYFNECFGLGTLTDYLGMKFDFSDDGEYVNGFYIQNLLPFVAYHKIYDDWYRDSRIQTPAFGRVTSGTSTIGYLPYNLSTGSESLLFSCSIGEIINTYPFDSSSTNTTANSTYPLLLNDGFNVFGLRQRNWSKDYFTTAHLYPQQNDSVSGISVDSSSSFTIPDLRAANVVQRWIERNNIAGLRYSDQLKATFGIYPSDAVLDRAIFLGSTKFGVYNKSVYSTYGSGVKPNIMNPFAGVGSAGASSHGSGDSSLVKSFTATEHGYLMVLASLVPHLYYGSGSRRYLFRRKVCDFANPLLQGLGEQAIHTWELDSTPYASIVSSSSDPSSVDYYVDSGSSVTVYSTLMSSDDVFGYTQQYAEYKYHEDEVHGLLRDTGSLASFCLQSSFSDPELSSEFIQIPTDYMDGVTAVSSTLSDYGAWYDMYFSFKKVSTLSEYVVPTLGDLRNTHKENIPYNGTRL